MNLPNFRGTRGAVMRGDERERGVPWGVGPAVVPVRPIQMDPLRERLEGNDTTDYGALIPYATGNFQTFWHGNQLPGALIHTAPHPYYVRVTSQDYSGPQLKGGSFGPNLGTQNQNSLLQRWHAIWTTATAAYSPG